MRAIIMAGGKGTRLKPLTCAKPKPMVSLANNPIMTHTIELLKKNGIKDIGVTLQYMAQHIMDYYANGKKYGVNLSYFLEDIPLGTAGSVKNAQDFLDETFLVISGDGLTDIDISKAVAFHKERKSLVTLILTSVPNPLEYGIVVTNEKSEITKFLEKPSWGEVFSDKINTGMYILEPEVLNYIPSKTFFDFSKNLFPLLMDQGIILNGYNGTGYWCDIGNCEAYLQAHVDILTDKVSTYLPYQEFRPQIWVGENTKIHPSAQLVAPLVIGSNCYIGASAILGPHTFLGDNCIINAHTSVKRSVVWNGVQIGKGAAIRGGVLCSNVYIKNNVEIYEGAIIGHESTLNENCTVKPGAKVWPSKLIDAGTVLKSNLVWGTKFSRNLFASSGIKGQLNIDLSLEQILQIASAFGSLIKNTGGNIAVGSDVTAISGTVKQAIISGLQVVGQQVYDLGEQTLPICRFAINKGNFDGGVFIRFGSENNLMQIIFLNEQGANISNNLKKQIENTYSINDFRYVPYEKIKKVKVMENIYDLYFASLRDTIKCKLDFQILLTCPSPRLSQSIGGLLEDLGCTVNIVNADEFNSVLEGNKKIDMGMKFDNQAEKAILFDDQKKAVNSHQLKVLIAEILFNKYQDLTLVAAIDEPSILEGLAREYGNNVLRCKTDLYHRMENMLKQGECGKKQFFMESDGIYAVLHIMEYLNEKEINLSQALANLPQFHIHKDMLSCPWESKGKIIRSLLENFKDESMNSIEGAKFIHPQGHILILPDSEKPLVNLITESNMMEAAQDITNIYKEKIQSLIGNS